MHGHMNVKFREWHLPLCVLCKLYYSIIC